MSNLKECPFCGGSAAIRAEYDDDGLGSFHYVESYSSLAPKQVYEVMRDYWGA